MYTCRAWVVFNGSTAALIASANVSSVTRLATGRWTINHTIAMPNANQCIVACAKPAASATALRIIDIDPDVATTATAIQIRGGYDVNREYLPLVTVALFA